MNDSDEELLSAYLDGEVTADEQARVELRLADDAGYRQLYDELRALRQRLESLPPAKLPADFSQAVLEAAERQMVAPLRGSDSRDGTDSQNNAPLLPQRAPAPGERRWARSLVWSGLIAAAAVLVMIFSPAEQAPNTARVSKKDARQRAAETAAAQSEPSIEASPNSISQSDDSLVAAPAVLPAEVGKQQEYGTAGKMAARKLDDQRVAETRDKAGKDLHEQFRAPQESQHADVARQEKNRRGSPAGAAGGAGADRDEGSAGLSNRATAALKKSGETPPAPGNHPSDEATRLSQQNARQNAQAATGAVAPAPKALQPRAAQPQAPGAGFGGPAAPADAAAPAAGGLNGPGGLAGQGGQGAGGEGLGAARTAPFGGEAQDLARLEAAQGEPARALNIAVRLTEQGAKLEEFEKLLPAAKPMARAGGKLRPQQADAQFEGAETPEALREDASKREEEGNRAKDNEAAPQVYELELDHGALVELLAQMRSRPNLYRIAPMSAALGQDVKRRADELVIQRKQEQQKELAQEKAEGKLADGKSKDANEEDLAAKHASPAKPASPAIKAAADNYGFKSAQLPGGGGAATAAPPIYRVRIVLSRGAADADPAAAKESPATAPQP